MMAEKDKTEKTEKGKAKTRGRPKGPRPMKAATFLNHLDEMMERTSVGNDDTVEVLIAYAEKQIVAEARNNVSG